ncbi:RNA polymerase Rpc34 [Lineolata rhizophorae]|uniref:DNA-directed RNA polymerase III subunit RPC6 n=1 Tax=Lineolata rhizophorae TaxID=578093 RepID=A0A6A6NT59_9PEZI|nr:RNA polymerase Rpc34 [Lineolata rhizophorae]
MPPATGSKADQLYERCAARHKPGHIFYQADLAGFNVADKTEMLIQLCQELVQHNLFQVLTHEGVVCWKLRSREDAAKFSCLTPHERLVYSHIEAVGTTGVARDTLRGRTTLLEAQFKRALHSLESKNFIKSFFNQKHASKRFYMLAELTPAEDASGGIFYSDGELDIDLIDGLSLFVLRFVEDASWAQVDPKKHQQQHQKGRRSVPASAIKQKKDAVQSARAHAFRSGLPGDPPRYKPPLSASGRRLVPRPPGHTYPTITEIHGFIVRSQVIQDVVPKQADIAALVEHLVFDGRLERMGVTGFRTTGITEAPCGSCPVFDLCEEGGPVNAGNCIYFAEWLETEEA